MSMDTNVVSNYERGNDSDTKDAQSISNDIPYDPTPREFDMDTPDLPGTAPVVVQDEEEDCQPTNVAAGLLKFHLKFNHFSPRKIQVMAEQGLLPTRLATCAIPVCSACQFDKDSKRPWRQKTRRNGSEVERAQASGDVISMDQMISRTPGIIAQMAGFLTKYRYTYATVFVDHNSNLSYLHFQKSTSAKYTLESKEAFKRFLRQRGVWIRNYHADHSTFAANDWVCYCYTKGQGLTFTSVRPKCASDTSKIWLGPP